jgi:hypothetical protein
MHKCILFNEHAPLWNWCHLCMMCWCRLHIVCKCINYNLRLGLALSHSGTKVIKDIPKLQLILDFIHCKFHTWINDVDAVVVSTKLTFWKLYSLSNLHINVTLLWMMLLSCGYALEYSVFVSELLTLLFFCYTQKSVNNVLQNFYMPLSFWIFLKQRASKSDWVSE